MVGVLLLEVMWTSLERTTNVEDREATMARFLNGFKGNKKM
jgi:hypothetical protein